jgi:hypothetical protein
MPRKNPYPYKFRPPWRKGKTKIRKNPTGRFDTPLRSVRKTYNIFTTPNKLEIFHPQFIAVDRRLVNRIDENDDLIEISTKPSVAKIRLFKGRIPLTHVNIAVNQRQRTLGKVI